MTVVTVVILGMGGLGCPAALALAESAKGMRLPLRLRLVDPDRVDRSNLPRQILFREQDRGRLKIQVAQERLAGLCEVEAMPVRFERATAPALIAGARVLLDGTDDFATRFLANDAAVAAGLPLVHGAALGWRGQIFTALPGNACLRCLFEGPPPAGTLPTCAEAGVAAPLCGMVGAAMAAEALALLRHGPQQLRAASALLWWDGRTGQERLVPVKRDPSCSACISATSKSSAVSR